MLTLPEGGDVGFVSPDAPVEAMLASLNFLLEQVAIQNGLPASAVTSKAREMSGAALLVENTELAEARRDQVALFAKVEQELFHLFRLIWNAHNLARPMSAGATLRTDFYEPQAAVSAYDRFTLFEKQYRMGVASLTDWMISQNPDLSRDDALEELIRISGENARMVGQAPSNNLTFPPFPTA